MNATDHLVLYVPRLLTGVPAKMSLGDFLFSDDALDELLCRKEETLESAVGQANKSDERSVIVQAGKFLSHN